MQTIIIKLAFNLVVYGLEKLGKKVVTDTQKKEIKRVCTGVIKIANDFPQNTKKIEGKIKGIKEK